MGVCEYSFGAVASRPREVARLSPKPLKSTSCDHPEGSPKSTSGCLGPKNHFGPAQDRAQHVFRRTELQAKSYKVLRLPIKPSLAELIAHSGAQPHTAAHRCVSVTRSAARTLSSLPTRVGGKDALKSNICQDIYNTC